MSEGHTSMLFPWERAFVEFQAAWSWNTFPLIAGLWQYFRLCPRVLWRGDCKFLLQPLSDHECSNCAHMETEGMFHEELLTVSGTCPLRLTRLYTQSTNHLEVILLQWQRQEAIVAMATQCHVRVGKRGSANDSQSNGESPPKDKNSVQGSHSLLNCLSTSWHGLP